jgi:cytosine/adenosine deaminase-related metal-dependent hydrolase
MNILLKNATIVTQNKNRDVFSGDIRIEGNQIKEVSPHIHNSGVKEFDLSGMTVIPGLVQTHVHLCQALFRNLADDLELLDWLTRYIWPMEMAHTEGSLRASARLGLYEILTSGVTTILDMGNARHMNAVFEEMQQSGIRGFSGKVMMDSGGQPYKETTKEAIESTEALIRQWHGTANQRIQYALAPRFVLTCSDRMWDAVREMSRDYNILIHTHSSENRAELKIVRSQTGYSNVEFFVKNDLASAKLCLAHCVWLTDQEMEYLREYQINVLHCPSANLKLGSGFAPVPRMLENNINVALGSDGAPCNNNLDIFTDMRLAALIHKPNFGVNSITAQQVLDMATISGAKAVGLSEKIGSVEPGKLADLTILNLNKVHLIPADNVVSQLVYSVQSRDVEHVMIDGEWVVQSGIPTMLNSEENIINEARRECTALINRLQ